MENGAAKNPESERLKAIVRALLALMFGFSVCYGFLFARINNLTLVSSDAFSTIALAVILWWFNKDMSESRARETAAAVAAAVAPVPPTPPTPEAPKS
jgi:hypothetical protein